MTPANYNTMDQMERRRVREQYAKDQDGLCHHCHAPLTGSPPTKVTSLSVTATRFPPNFFKHPVHLHHDHKTGMTIGAVHSYCNAVLWQYHGE